MSNKCEGECNCHEHCECAEEEERCMEEWKSNNSNATPEEFETEKNRLGVCRYCDESRNKGDGSVRHCYFCEDGCDCIFCTEEKVWEKGERDPRRNSNAYSYGMSMGGEWRYNNGTFLNQNQGRRVSSWRA